MALTIAVRVDTRIQLVQCSGAVGPIVGFAGTRGIAKARGITRGVAKVGVVTKVRRVAKVAGVTKSIGIANVLTLLVVIMMVVLSTQGSTCGGAGSGSCASVHASSSVLAIKVTAAVNDRATLVSTRGIAEGVGVT